MDDDGLFMLLVALAKVEAITGQAPSLPVMKAEQKPPALTADALKLGSGVESQADVVKPVPQPIQSVPICLVLHVLLPKL